ncbi:hypothetical protein [Salmonella phage PHA46]
MGFQPKKISSILLWSTTMYRISNLYITILERLGA